MAYKIGVFGSAKDITLESEEKASEVGKILAEQNCIVITGATTGLTFAAAKAAKQAGGETWGFSPALNFEEHLKVNNGIDKDIYSSLIYIPPELKMGTTVCRKFRNVSSTAACDGGIIISGQWGTLNEFTNLADFGKVIGVLTDTGGIADELFNLSEKIKKRSGSLIFFSNNPKDLIEKVLNELKIRTAQTTLI